MSGRAWGAAASALLGAAVWFFVSLGRWYQFSEPPRKADLIVILCGDPSRAVAGAKLYHEGYAPEIWVGHVFREAYFQHLDKLGIRLPREEEIIRRALIERGVPPAKVKFYGNDNLSTLEEAQGLRKALGTDDKKIMIVTSLYHERRARLIFRSVFPRAALNSVSDGDKIPQFPWWAHKFVAEAVAKEFLATVYFELGGDRLNHRP